MQVHRDINNLPIIKNAVITIGTFDGVHTGHLQIIDQLNETAKKVKGESVIITFHPHPRMIIISDKSEIKLLNTVEEKIELLSNHKVDHLVVIPFTKEFAEQSAEEYIRGFLVKTFHPHTIITGYDHHFGKNRTGNYKLLESYSREFNYKVKEIPEHVLNQVIISSTKIRNAILQGDIETANKYLGYPYFFEGTVVEGDKIGRTIGYPTANITVEDENKLIPGDGIYAVELAIDRQSNTLYKGMLSIGERPTIENSKRVIEVNIFNFNENIYQQHIRIFIKKYFREQKKFTGLQQLKTAIELDKKNIINYFADDQV